MNNYAKEMQLPPIFVICNPKYEPDRYSFLCKHFPARGIPLEKVHFVHGPWGSELKEEEIWNVYKPFKNRFGEKVQLCFKAAALSKGEISLNMSFAKLISIVCSLPKEIEHVLIFESDIVLREDFLPRLQDLMKEAETKAWDYISLGEGVGTRPKEVSPLSSYFSPTKLYPSGNGPFVFRCCDSMLFKREILEKIARTFLPFRECLDWEMNLQFLVHKGTSLWADPPLCEPGTNRHRILTYLPS